jgi:hypothetical protein
MNGLPHFAKFARSLALGVTAGGVAIAACSGSTASTDTGNGAATTTTTASSGNETPPPAETTAADAGPSASVERPVDAPVAPVAQGNACATVGATSRAVASRPGTESMCECVAGAAGSATWSCSDLPMRVMGPLPPPELSA